MHIKSYGGHAPQHEKFALCKIDDTCGVIYDVIAELLKAAIILEQKWALRGLDHIYLDLIKEMFIKIECFKVDISLLDGNHRLC